MFLNLTRFATWLLSMVMAAVLAMAAPQLASAQTNELLPPGYKQPSDFPKARLSIVKDPHRYVIDASVAANEANREQGLMYRTRLAPNEGMLFIFDRDAGHCFWMKNTLLPLSIAFIRADGTITDLDEMQAETTTNHCPTHRGRYALEMSKGWFATKGIKPGMRVAGLPRRG